MADPRRAGMLLAILGMATLTAHSEEVTDTWEAHNKAGWQAYEDAKYAEADDHLRAAFALAQHFAANDMRKATSYGRLAALLLAQGRAADAEPLVAWAISVREMYQGREHLDLAFELQTLAEIKWDATQRKEAESLARRALAIREKSLGADHRETGENVIALARIVAGSHRYAEAEPLFKRGLATVEKGYGPKSQEVAG